MCVVRESGMSVSVTVSPSFSLMSAPPETESALCGVSLVRFVGNRPTCVITLKCGREYVGPGNVNIRSKAQRCIMLTSEELCVPMLLYLTAVSY